MLTSATLGDREFYGATLADAALRIATLRFCHLNMPLEIAGEKYLSTNEVLEEIGVSRQTLWRWRQEGKIPSGHRFRDGHILFALADVEAIRTYAYRVEPATVPSVRQMRLFAAAKKGGSHGIKG